MSRQQTALAIFASDVLRLAISAKGDAVWLDGRVFVSELAKKFPQMRMVTFKSMLIDAAEAGLILLSRADLIGAYPKEKLLRSEIRHNGETYHFVETSYLRRR